ncbi:MAG: biopolymer transporter ExbD [Elusimicrobia bacterium]|nr:biopolymer transporter ExbD [Elusimicrobiota bacterium]
MATASGNNDGPITAINVTPFVDIILVVLIIFMATAPIIARRAIKVDVPKAAHHDRAATEAKSIVYNAKRELILEGKKLSSDELKSLLAAGTRADPDLHVTLSADKTIPYGDIVGVLDLVRGAGVRKIGLEVSRK